MTTRAEADVTAERRPSKMTDVTKIDGPFYHVKTHGGLGDCLWVLGKKLCNLRYPLFVSVACENRHRPRRVGRMLDHLSCVVGWAYADTTFAPGGADWTQSADDPACAVGKTWAELDWKPNTRNPYRIECNRWLESGRRLEDWLPDLPTTHRVDWLTPGPPNAQFKRPSIVVHIAGWPDVPDATWVSAIRLFAGLAHVYVVGGSYDHRPRRVCDMVGRSSGVTLMEDVDWEDLFGVLGACSYCFGHASGFTAIADTLRVDGVTFNPRTVPDLIDTWNDPDHGGMVHVDRVSDFDRVVHAAYTVMNNSPAATWPPSAARGALLTAVSAPGRGPAAAAVYAAAAAAMPRQAVFLFDAAPTERDVAAACIDAVIDSGELIQAVVMADADPRTVASVYGASARTTRRPIVDTPARRAVVTERPVTYGLAVVLTDGDRARAARSVHWAWAHTTAGGTLLVGGPSARDAVHAVAGAKRIRPGEVVGSPGWWYAHRQL